MKKKNVELIISGFLICCSVAIYFIIIPREVGHGGFHGLSPALFPKISTLIIGILSGFIFIKALVKKDITMFSLTKKEFLTVSIFAVGILAYIYSIRFVGYYISTILALIGSMLYLGFRKWRTMILLVIIMLLSLYFFFEKGLRITMPRWFI